MAQHETASSSRCGWYSSPSGWVSNGGRSLNVLIFFSGEICGNLKHVLFFVAYKENTARVFMYDCVYECVHCVWNTNNGISTTHSHMVLVCNAERGCAINNHKPLVVYRHRINHLYMEEAFVHPFLIYL